MIKKTSGDARKAVRETDMEISKIQDVSGSGARGRTGLNNDSVRALDQAEQISAKACDSYVTAERLLVALALSLNTAAGKALKAAGVTAEGLNTAIFQLRGGRTADTE